MSTKYLKYSGREIEVETEFELDEGVYILSGVYLDNNEELTEEALKDVEEKFQSELYRGAHEMLVDAMYERAKSYRKYGET